MEKPNLVIKREFAFADMARAYKVLVDGKQSGTIMPKDTLQLHVPPGRHQVQFKVDWCTSPVIDVDVQDDQQTVVVCKATHILPVTALLTLPLMFLGMFTRSIPQTTAFVALGAFIVTAAYVLTINRGEYIFAEARA